MRLNCVAQTILHALLVSSHRMLLWRQNPSCCSRSLAAPRTCATSIRPSRRFSRSQKLPGRGCSFEASVVCMAAQQATSGVDGEQHQSSPRVLSIQSHVVHGYVGNKCAVFPLQILGFEVDPISSVQFSNHTGYPSFKGAVFDGQHLSDLLQGLQDNQLLGGYTHLLTGYIGSVSLLETIAEVSRKLKAANSQVTYVCDPVMGDEGRLYVKPELVGAYRDHILPLADVIVPNQFEAELLADRGHIRSVEDGFAICEALHERGPHTVIITSMTLESEPGAVLLIASTKQPQAQGPQAQRLTLRIPRIDAYYTGTGDLMAALLLAWMHLHPGDLALAVEKATAGLQAVLQGTAKASGPAALASDRTAAVCAARELKLIQHQAKIVSPQVVLKASLHKER